MNGENDGKLPPLRVLLAAPRGFCAGVDRAVRIVEEALQRRGAPVYVRHEIVHNRTVVDELRQRGAVFVEDLAEVPDAAQVVFSAHGVPKSIPAEARRRALGTLDATCPLVTKVHLEAERHHAAGRHVLMIGHHGHPEVEGTLGQLPPGSITLIEDVRAARGVLPADPARLAFITQTTLSVDDTAEIVAILRSRFPAIAGPRHEDICYATANRQAAVKAIAGDCNLVIVLGGANSSNSRRLCEVAERVGTPARLLQDAHALDPATLDGIGTLGVSAGASTPERLVTELVEQLATRFTLSIEERRVVVEDVTFRLPPQLAG